MRETEREGADWVAAFTARVTERRIPVSGLLELTSRCNLRCVHCYLGPQDKHWARRDDEMSLEKVLGVIDEVADAGCLYLGITGGDPMVHDHFPRVYRRAKERGLIVSVLCNGILVRDEIVDLFQEMPPSVVEVSLYGATRQTYEAVTQVQGSYVKCLAGVRRLLDAGIRVELKTVVMTLNAHEVAAMRAIADDLGVEFRMDAGIFPQLEDRDLRPLQLRVTPEEAVAQEFQDPETARQWARRVQRQPVPSNALYRCGAGVTGFYIDPYGNASPCLMTSGHRHSMESRSFGSLWDRELVQIRSQQPGDHYGCNSCEMQSACTSCPAFNALENGEGDRRSEYLCDTTRARWERLQVELPGLAAAGAVPPTAGADPGGWSPLRFDARRQAVSVGTDR